MNSQVLRLGLVGCGRHGIRYATHLLAGDVPGARLVAISRRNAAEGRSYARAHGLRFHADPVSLAEAEELDGVVLCVPPDLNPRLALAALNADKAVLVEKPLASTKAGALAIERAARERTLMVAQTLRFNSVVRAMSAAAPDLGSLHGFSASQRYEPLPLDWIEDPERGGALRVTGVHSFDLVRHLTGAEAVRVSCEVFPAGYPAEADRAFAAVLRMEPGPILATIDNSRHSSGRSGRIELVGERGSLVGDHVRGELFRLSAEGTAPVPVAAPVHTVRECLRAFIAAARGEMPVPVTATDGRRAVEILEACGRSAAKGRPVRIVRRA